MRVFFLLLSAYLILSLNACKTSQPNRPMEMYNEGDRHAAKNSIMRIPVDIDLFKLEESLNHQMTDLLYEDDSFDDGDKMKVKAYKDGTIRLSATGHSFTYEVPLSLWIQYDLGLGKVEATARLSLSFITNYAIESDWSLVTNTSLQEYSWKERPRLRMGRISIPVESIANLLIGRSAETIGTNIDEMVAETFKLEEYISDAWAAMFQPFELSEEYKTWLLVNPRNIGMTPVKVVNGRLQSTVVVESMPALQFGDEPPASLVLRMPSFSYRYLNEEAEQGFQILLDATVPYEEAERLTRQSVKGERFEQGRRHVVVEDIELYGQGNNLVVNVQLSGSYNGSIYLTGEPVFNARRNRIEMEDLEYTLDSKNFLLRSAAWLAKGPLVRMIQNNMDYLLDYNIEDAKKQMKEQLSDYEVAQGIRLNGDLEDLDIYNAYLTPSGIKVVMAINGSLGVKVEELSDFGK